jgi:DNA-binding NarL/FixJ family response regulator
MKSPLRPGPIRVVTVEDDPRYRTSLEVLLRHTDEFALVGSYATSADVLTALIPAVRTDSPPICDLVLMDVELPGMNGIECTHRIKTVLPDVLIVVLTVFEDRATVVEAICAGADGYLLKRTPADLLLHLLRAVVAGGSPLSAGVAKTVLDLVRQVNDGRPSFRSGKSTRVDLTSREADVLRCLVQGMSYKAVAKELGVSIDTVRSHIRAVYRKLQVRNVAEAVRRALSDRLV